jgi:uncharacterized protein YecE (DUF72 family)
MPGVSIGCSGFNYSHWRGTFYPRKMPQRKWFQHYCSVFSSVELNVTFYRLPASSTFDKWYQETPDDFGFSLKGSRYITHIKRLLITAESLDLFFNGALRLKEKLKVVLWQFPPTFKINTERLILFLNLLRNFPVRNTLEFRHESWITSDVIDICNEHGTGLCMADWPVFIDSLPVTADFVYIRRHGEGGRYDSCYSREELKKDSRRIKRYLKDGRDVFIYFNNDAYGYAPRNAKELTDLLRSP